MRGMGLMRNITLLLIFYCLPSSVLWAVEFDVQAEKVRWRYQEYAKDVKGFDNYLPSRSEGKGSLVKVRLSSERDEEWFFALSGAMMDTASAAEEEWNTLQVNELSISQKDVRLDAQYRMLGARFGIWLANRKQTQNRGIFYVSGVLTPVTGEPVPEEIISRWAGLSLTSVGGNMGQFETRLDAALALNVDVTNPLFAAPFTKKDGYRTGIHFRWTLPKQEVGVEGLNITLRYEYQELGGENSKTNGFWPYNRWQMASLGLMYAW